MLQQLFSNDLFSLLLVFSRIGSAVMLLPGFGENYVSPRIRLLLAASLTVVLTPAVIDSVPPQPETFLEIFLLVLSEVVIGLFYGGLTRMMVSALHVGGTIIGLQSSLGNATMFDPSSATQGSVTAALFNIIGVFLIFASDLHHLMLTALAGTYSVFPPGSPPPIGDLTGMATNFLAKSFALGMQIAAPFLVVGLVFYIGLGLLARLMPQVQVFFIAIPLQIALSFFLMIITLSAGMMWFLTNFQDSLNGLLGG